MKFTTQATIISAMATMAFAASPQPATDQPDLSAVAGGAMVDPRSPGVLLAHCLDPVKADKCKSEKFPQCTISDGSDDQKCLCAHMSDLTSKCITTSNLITNDTQCDAGVISSALTIYKLAITSMCQNNSFPVDVSNNTASVKSSASTVMTVGVSALVAYVFAWMF